MSTNEVFMIPDNRGGQNSFDPNLLLASMMNGNNGLGGNGNWIWVIFLFFLYPLMRNGGFGAIMVLVVAMATSVVLVIL